MLIEMIQEDIDNASGELSSLSCPVALAVKRNLPKDTCVSVTADHIHIFRVNDDQRSSVADNIDGRSRSTSSCEKYKPSVKEREMVANFIRDFDNNLDVQKLPAFKIRKARKL